MFDVGFAEVFLLSLIGLLILGPERLPAVARTLGGLIRKARSSWYSLRRSIETELDAANIAEPIKSAGKELSKVAEQLSEIDVDPISRSQQNDADGSDSEKTTES